MTKSEAIHRAALRKHRHKGNYISTHDALLAEAEYLQQTQPMTWEGRMVAALMLGTGAALFLLSVVSLVLVTDIIKGWFA